MDVQKPSGPSGLAPEKSIDDMSSSEYKNRRRAAEQKRLRRQLLVRAPEVPDGEKLCDECGTQFPATADYFHRDAYKEDGLKATCRSCRSKRNIVSEDGAIATRLKKMELESAELLDQLTSGGSSIPHQAELLECLVHAMGGVQGFSKHVMATYLAATPGSATRQKLLDMIVKLTIKVTEHGDANLPVELMTDDDLEKELQRKLMRVKAFKAAAEDDAVESGVNSGHR